MNLTIHSLDDIRTAAKAFIEQMDQTPCLLSMAKWVPEKLLLSKPFARNWE